MDNLNAEQRHRCMSRICSKDTKIEIRLRNALRQEGIRYRKNYSKLPGSPDIAITKYCIAVFCDSEFFHGKNFDTVLLYRLQKGNNPDYWIQKIQRNMMRDQEITRELLQRGWIVLRFWGNDIRKHLPECVQTIKDAIIDRITENIIL